jgi:putative ABC transport system permease protein
VLGFAAVLSIGAGLAVGLIPALTASRSRASDSLRDGARATTSRAGQRLRAGLVVAQVALATTLTVGAGLLLRSFLEVLGVDPGFRSEQLLTFQMFVPSRFPDNPARLTFYDDVEAQLRKVPGVLAVGGTTRLPLGTTEVTSQVDVQGRDVPPSDRPEVAFRRAVYNYFETLQIPLVRGRTFSRDDAIGAPLVVIVNTAFAERVFPGEDPIGRQVRFGAGAVNWYTIVGVVGSIRHGSLEEPPRPEVYIHYRQGSPVSPYIAIRALGDLAALERDVRQILRERGADPPAEVRSMTEVRDSSVAERRFVLALVAVFGTLSLALAALGVYGVITLVAAERTREVGIRLALGATPGTVLGLVVSQAARLAVIGIAAGSVFGVAAASAMRSQLFGVGAADPITYVTVAALLLIVAAGAALVPGRRAMRTDPALTLRG